MMYKNFNIKENDGMLTEKEKRILDKTEAGLKHLIEAVYKNKVLGLSSKQKALLGAGFVGGTATTLEELDIEIRKEFEFELMKMLDRIC